MPTIGLASICCTNRRFATSCWLYADTGKRCGLSGVKNSEHKLYTLYEIQIFFPALGSGGFKAFLAQDRMSDKHVIPIIACDYPSTSQSFLKRCFVTLLSADQLKREDNKPKIHQDN